MNKYIQTVFLSLISVIASQAIAGDNGGALPTVPEISSGLAPLAVGAAVGLGMLYHEWRKKK